MPFLDYVTSWCRWVLNFFLGIRDGWNFMWMEPFLLGIYFDFLLIEKTTIHQNLLPLNCDLLI
jgi:hypothetical protein